MAAEDPVEIVFDAVQTVLDEQAAVTRSWSEVDVKRFAALTKSYLEHSIAATRKRLRDEEQHHSCTGSSSPCNHHDDEVQQTGSAEKQEVGAGDRAELADRVFRLLHKARICLKTLVPFGSVTESIHIPKTNPMFDPLVPSVDVDAFLYDQHDIDDLVEQKLLSRSYCIDCKSTNIGDVQFVSHSFSAEQLVYLFCYGLPEALAAAKSVGPLKLCDVGSRFGIVLAAAASFLATSPRRNPPARSLVFSKVTGVEFNKNMCDVQTKALAKLRLASNAVEVLCADALSEEGIAKVRESDVVVLHNVFEWFQEESAQLRVWKTLRGALSRQGQIIVAVPTLEESICHLAEHFGNSSTDGFSSASDAKAFIENWVLKVDVTSCVSAFEAERLVSTTDEDLDEETQSAKEEVLELVNLINFYVVKG